MIALIYYYSRNLRHYGGLGAWQESMRMLDFRFFKTVVHSLVIVYIGRNSWHLILNHYC